MNGKNRAKTIIVGIDIRDLKIAKTGTKTYLEEICRAFQKDRPGFKFYFFDTIFPIYSGKNKLFKLVEHLRFSIWKQAIIPLLAFVRGCDIIFCTDFFVPYVKLGYETIPVFHDAFFWEYPEHYHKFWRKIFHTLGVSAAKKSAYVIAPTEYAKERIAHYSGLSNSKIIAIPEAPKTLASNPSLSSGALNLKTKKYFLHIGTFEKRKNLCYLVEALHLLRELGYKDYSLVLCGQISPKNPTNGSQELFDVIKKYNLHDYVIMPGYVKDNDLSWYYRNAEVYLFPSINEGFGLPILEAFQNNLPVLVANNTCLPEVGGDAVITFDPYNPEDLVKNIIHLLNNADQKAKLIERGRERLVDFSWERTANELLEVFNRAKTTPSA